MTVAGTNATSGAATRYSSFVDPEHALVGEIFPPAGTSGSDLASAEPLLARLREKCLYITRPGHRSFDDLRAQPRGAKGRLELNCINMICLLVSGLRRAGRGEDEVFVALAGARGYLTFHAWALIRRGGEDGFWWIDPIDLVPRPRNGRELIAGHDIYAIFNDRRLAFTASEKRALLTGEAA